MAIRQRFFKISGTPQKNEVLYPGRAKQESGSQDGTRRPAGRVSARWAGSVPGGGLGGVISSSWMLPPEGGAGGGRPGGGTSGSTLRAAVPLLRRPGVAQPPDWSAMPDDDHWPAVNDLRGWGG